MKDDSSITNCGDWVVRMRPGKGNRILLLLHGWTGDENSMSIFFQNLPKDYWIVAPRAKNKAGTNGYSWRAPAQKGSWPTVELFKPAVDGLVDLIDCWCSQWSLKITTFDVVGFSQGGALAMALGVLHAHRLGKMGVLAGFAPKGLEEYLQPGILNGKKVFIAHGTLDEIVPISMARSSKVMLADAGAEVEYCESEIGHRISADCIKSLNGFLAQ